MSFPPSFDKAIISACNTDLVTSVVAVLKKETAISVGNILESNLFNVVAVVGASAVILPIDVPSRADLVLLALITVSVFLVYWSKIHYSCMGGVLHRISWVYLLLYRVFCSVRFVWQISAPIIIISTKKLIISYAREAYSIWNL